MVGIFISNLMKTMKFALNPRGSHQNSIFSFCEWQRRHLPFVKRLQSCFGAIPVPFNHNIYYPYGRKSLPFRWGEIIIEVSPHLNGRDFLPFWQNPYHFLEIVAYATEFGDNISPSLWGGNNFVPPQPHQNGGEISPPSHISPPFETLRFPPIWGGKITYVETQLTKREHVRGGRQRVKHLFSPYMRGSKKKNATNRHNPLPN